MAITRLFCCVLIQVLLITVYGEIKINCRNQTGTVGEPLNLSCNVTCTVPSETIKCSWTLNNNEKFNCSKENMDAKNMRARLTHTFNWTIDNASKNHRGNYTFWVQMNTGSQKTMFNLSIVDPPTTDPTDNGITAKSEDKQNKNKEYRSNTIAALLVIVFVLAIIIMLVLCQKRKNRERKSFTEQCTCQQI